MELRCVNWAHSVTLKLSLCGILLTIKEEIKHRFGVLLAYIAEYISNTTVLKQQIYDP